MKAPTIRNMSLMAAARDCWPSAAVQDAIAMVYWRTFGKQVGDVFLCSYPKSGRTWLRFLLTYYQIRLAGIDFHLNLKTYPQLSPNLTLFTDFRLRTPPVDAPIHRVLGTHSEIPFLFRGLPIIVLRRDVRDVLVSYYYHRLARGEIQGDLEAFIWSPWGVHHIVRYQNRWDQALSQFMNGNVLELKYERMHSDPHGCVRKCLEFMQIEIREDLITETVGFASAAKMRQLEAYWGTPDFTAKELQCNENAFQVRKAKVGNYQEEFSINTAARIGAILRQELIDCRGYDY